MEPDEKYLNSRQKMHKRKRILKKSGIRIKRNYIKRTVKFKCTPTTHLISISDLRRAKEGHPISPAYTSRRAVVKGSWKIIPKDSCEVCRERRKRERKRQKNNENKENKQTTDPHRREKQTNKKKEPRGQKQSSASATSSGSSSTSRSCSEMDDD